MSEINLDDDDDDKLVFTRKSSLKWLLFC